MFVAVDVSGDDIRGRNSLALCNPLNFTRPVQGRENAEYDCLSIGDMTDLVDLLSEVIHLGAHRHMFCSILHFNL